MTALDPRPETYAHAAALAAMLDGTQQDEHPELEDGRPPLERDAD